MATAIIPEGAIAGDAGAAELARAIEDKVEGLGEIVGRLTGFLVEYRRIRGSGGADEHDTALEELDQLRSGAEAVHQGLRLLIEDALNEGVPSPGTVSDAMITRNLDEAWARARVELDRAHNEDAVWQTVERLAGRATGSADSTMLQALRGRLPRYLSERGFDDAVSRVRPRIDEIEAPALLPRMRVAVLARAAIETGWPRVLAAFDLVRGEVGMGNPPVRELPGFGNDEMIPVPNP